MKNIIRKITPKLIISLYHMILPFWGALIYNFPSKKIEVIGVTGTNGKTTTVNMIHDIFKEAGYQTAVLSSIKFQIKDQEYPNMLKMTMPGRTTIHKFLKQAVNNKCQYAIIEVSSEGIKQFRHLFLNFKTAVITNLSPEHIESHGSFNNYKKTKGKLFKKTTENHILNLDDKHKDYFNSFQARNKLGYGIKFKETFNGTKVIADNCETNNQGISFSVNNTKFKLNILGEFNIYNALAAISTGLAYNISLETCRRALNNSKTVPGRMEIVASYPLRVIVDYAVTPDALEQLYKTIKKNFSQGKIIAVLGSCGGGRDKWKRPILGKIASEYCHEIIITNEDPYDEDPMQIINSIAQGVENKKIVHKILDRRQAIRKALSLAEKEDNVVITGKGCEPWMCLANNEKIPWDDRQIARQELDKIIEKG